MWDNINSTIERFSQAARREQLSSPDSVQKTKAPSFGGGVSSDTSSEIVIYATVIEAPAYANPESLTLPNGRPYYTLRLLDTVIPDSGTEEYDTWANGVDYAADKVVKKVVGEVETLYKCIVPHKSGGDEVADPEETYHVGDRIWDPDPNADTYICTVEGTTETGSWEEDNDEPGVGGAWATYWVVTDRETEDPEPSNVYDAGKKYSLNEQCLFLSEGAVEAVASLYKCILVDLPPDPATHTYQINHQPDTSPTYWEKQEEIKVEYAIGKMSTEENPVELRQFIPWYSAGEEVPIISRVIDEVTVWFIDKTFTYCGPDSAASIAGNQTDKRAMAVYK